MGLLDSVLGAATGGQQGQGTNAALGGGGLGALIGMFTSNPQMLQAITSMLNNNGSHGGLGGFIEKFQQAGMGNVASSWVGHGENQPISGDQLTNVLGADAMSGFAQKMGMNQGDAAGQLSSLLPGLIDKLTPHGRLPDAGY